MRPLPSGSLVGPVGPDRETVAMASMIRRSGSHVLPPAVPGRALLVLVVAFAVQVVTSCSDLRTRESFRSELE